MMKASFVVRLRPDDERDLTRLADEHGGSRAATIRHLIRTAARALEATPRPREAPNASQRPA